MLTGVATETVETARAPLVTEPTRLGTGEGLSEAGHSIKKRLPA